jgi:hypothetical protein
MVFIYFKETAPEGCAVLQHYYFGDGKPLHLKSSYLPTSPVINKALKGMQIGAVKKIAFKQKEDWRLSYALNPFYLKKKRKGFEIKQFIKFDNKGNLYTYIKIGSIQFKIVDNWVHILNTKPYMLYYNHEGKYSKN